MNFTKVYNLILEADAIRDQTVLDRQYIQDTAELADELLVKRGEELKQAIDLLRHCGVDRNDVITVHALMRLETRIARIGDDYLDLANEISKVLEEKK
jgi:hypothetical protein